MSSELKVKTKSFSLVPHCSELIARISARVSNGFKVHA